MSARAIGLIANASKPRAADIAPALIAALRQRGLEVLVDPPTTALVADAKSVSRADLAKRCSLIVILGGDGTILEVLRDFGAASPPIFGINLGSLGFLTTVGSAAWEQAAEAIATGKYDHTERTLLHVELIRDGEIIANRDALNDAVIGRGELSRLIRVGVKIDGAHLTDYNADGLIVSTPTGSTAYALSAGGPVLVPDSGVFVIAPICPHVLTMRPVIVSDRSVIEITPIRGTPGVFLTIDGRKAKPVNQGDLIRLTRSPHRLHLATLRGMTFFEVLRKKLKWSGSAV